jgi:DNA-binding IclR family transcriptional regulator
MANMSELSTLARGIDMLFLVGRSPPSMTVSEIASATNLLESTAYRYVATLRARGLLDECEESGHYRLGLRILELARPVVHQLDILRIGLPTMRSLVAATGETAVLAMIRGTMGICLEKVESSHGLKASWDRGATFRLHGGATGKAILAFASPGILESIVEKEGLVKLTDKTTTDLELLRQELADIREKGFAVTEGEETPGVRAIAAPIFDHLGNITASLTIGGPVARLDWKATESAIPLVVEGAKEITRKLGGSWPT